MVTGDGATRFVRQRYDESADRYDAKIWLPEQLLFRGGRVWAARQAVGQVLEIAVGTGRNLAHYPADTHVTGIDLSARMVDVARDHSRRGGLDVDLHVGDAQRLPFADASFDTVVATLALCTIPDDAAAVREIARVLRPGGRLLLLEHVRSTVGVVRAAQRLLEPLLLRLEGDHLLREPHRQVLAAGLVVDDLRRSKLGLVLRLRAHKPA